MFMKLKKGSYIICETFYFDKSNGRGKLTPNHFTDCKPFNLKECSYLIRTYKVQGSKLVGEFKAVCTDSRQRSAQIK
jgi:5-methylcytosine-specific restriction endonuclease McrA